MSLSPWSTKCLLHFTGLRHRLKDIAAAQVPTRLGKSRQRIDHHPHSGHVAEMVPHNSRNDAAYLPDRKGRVGHEVQHEHGHGAIEGSIAERQGHGIRLLHGHARIGVALPRRLDKGGSVVDGMDGSGFGPARELECETSSAAADVEKRFARGDPRELHECRRQLAAPARHELVVAGCLMNGEGRRHRNPRCVDPNRFMQARTGDASHQVAQADADADAEKGPSPRPSSHHVTVLDQHATRPRWPRRPTP
jgi:hypothetical protein